MTASVTFELPRTTCDVVQRQSYTRIPPVATQTATARRVVSHLDAANGQLSPFALCSCSFNVESKCRLGKLWRQPLIGTSRALLNRGDIYHHARPRSFRKAL